MMSGDQIASAVGLSLMLLIVIQRLASRELQLGTTVRLAMIWVVIILIAIAAVWVIQSYMHRDLT